MKDETRKNFIDIVQAGEEIQNFVSGMDFSTYQDNPVTRRAVERDFEIIESVSKIAVALYDNLSKCEELSKKLRKENKDRVCRFVKWIRCTDTSMKSVLKQLFSAQISSHADVYWFTWQRARLYLMYTLDWLFIKNLPGSCEKEDISNNLYDIEYVTYLCRADGLLTNDQRLQVPLAKAAFPGKDVFEVNTTLNTSRKVQDVLDDIVEKIPPSYRIG